MTRDEWEKKTKAEKMGFHMSNTISQVVTTLRGLTFSKNIERALEFGPFRFVIVFENSGSVLVASNAEEDVCRGILLRAYEQTLEEPDATVTVEPDTQKPTPDKSHH